MTLSISQKKQLCQGCYNDVYNKPAGELVDGPGSGISPGECWLLEEAEMVAGLLVYTSPNCLPKDRQLRQRQLRCWRNEVGGSTVLDVMDVYMHLKERGQEMDWNAWGVS